MRYILHALSLITMAGLIGLSSCSKDDPAPRAKVSFDRSTRTFDESSGVVQVNVILDMVAGEDITVNYKVDGTAREGAAGTSGTDYEITSGSGQVKIKKGQANAVIELRIKDDKIFEDNETIEFEISSANPNVDISDDNTVTITISENDAQSEVSFSSPVLSAAEDANIVEVHVVLDGETPENMIVGYTISGTATDGTDYSIDNSGEIEIRKGQTRGTIRIDITDDVVYEGNETVRLSIDEVNLAGVLIGDDDEFVLTIEENDNPIIVSMSDAAWSVEESDGLIEVDVELKTPPATDVRVKFALSGSAVDYATAINSNPEIPFDYVVRTSTGALASGELVIKAGETYGSIGIQLISDYFLEDGNPATEAWDPETIIISLKASEGYQLGTLTQTTMSVKQEDGKAIALLWDEQANVDMDLVLWTLDSQVQPIAASTFTATDGFEMVFIPKAITSLVSDETFGLSYTYFGGAADPLDFQVQFIDFNGGYEAPGSRDIFNGRYTLANINAWQNFEDLQVEQTFNIINGAYNYFSPITIPASGSRVRSLKGSVPAYLTRRTSQTIPRAARPK